MVSEVRGGGVSVKWSEEMSQVLLSIWYVDATVLYEYICQNADKTDEIKVLPKNAHSPYIYS